MPAEFGQELDFWLSCVDQSLPRELLSGPRWMDGQAVSMETAEGSWWPSMCPPAQIPQNMSLLPGLLAVQRKYSHFSARGQKLKTQRLKILHPRQTEGF